jgi:hypothetical protein
VSTDPWTTPERASRTYTRAVVVRHAAGQDVAAEACVAKNASVAAWAGRLLGCTAAGR